MAAYLKDVENNTRDMTAQRIIKEKLNRVETKEVSISKNLLNFYCLILDIRKKKYNNIRCNIFKSHKDGTTIFPLR